MSYACTRRKCPLLPDSMKHEPVRRCTARNCPDRTITNASRITSSVEALAKFITEIADCSECEEMHGFRMCDAAPDKSCEDCWAGWLRQEVTE